MNIIILRNLRKGQRGQVLLLAMVMLAIGGLIIGPLMGLVTTGLNVGRHTEIKVDEYYAADAGVENALWFIRQKTQNPAIVPESTGDENAKTFTLPADQNGYSVTFTITKVSGSLYKIESITNPTGTAVIAYVVSGNLDIFDGALVSSGTITLKKESVVDGDIYSLQEFLPPGDLTHVDTNDGTPTILDAEDAVGLTFPTTQENAAFADTFKQEAIAGGTLGDPNLNIAANEIYSFPSATYINGNFTVGIDATITLNGTIYVEGYIDFDKSATLLGHGSIVAVEYINLGKTQSYGTTGDDLIFSVQGNIDFKKGDNDDPANTLNALIYAPYGSISFNKATTIVGGVVCGGGIDFPEEVSADKGFSVTYNPVYKDTMGLPGFNPTAIRTWTIY